VDRDHGGFITHLDRFGAVTSSVEKLLVMQTRMIYSFAAGAALGGPQEWLPLAHQGLVFFLRHFRDSEHDGWYWSVTRRGNARDESKRTYGHAFAAYALAEYARLAGDGNTLASAIHTASLIGEGLWDDENGGVIEACDRVWRVTDANHTMGTHLHCLEAFLALHEATGELRFWDRARDICDLIVTRMVEPDVRCGLEKFHPDWTHNSQLSRNLVNYGHNLEAAWLLLRAHRIQPSPAYRDTAREFLDYVVRFGLDAENGGVFSHGGFNLPATVREKVWWVQTEAMTAFLLGYIVLEDPRYWDAFRNVCDFSLSHLRDSEHGEWYPVTTEEGAPADLHKGSAWKSAYHVTQACVYAHEYLSEIGRAN
jgi:mannobiose 2-epimerase